MSDLFSLAGKTAVVTGGSRGIGAMIAQGFVRAGVKTYITARKVEELESTAAELSKEGECIAIAGDLGSQAGVEAFVAAIGERESSLDILVNNAGATWGTPLDTFPEEGWDKVMDLNVKSIFFLTQAFLPLLKAAGSEGNPARVVNIGSVNGLVNSKMDNYSYTASKAAVHHLTRHLGAELAPQYVNVNAIAPGFFPSKMTAHLLPHEKEMAALFPCRRLGNADDAAGTAIYLCSRASSWVTGQIVVLDGGLVAGS